MNPSASATRHSRRWSTIGATAAAFAACAVCCIGPLLAVLGAVGAVATVAAVWVPALAVVAVAALLGAVVVRRRAACQTVTGPVDLGLPAPRNHQNPATPTRR
ncbi:hypothetical protein MXD62_07220 [Frankia sp. Mgl5]|uniref:hypothetical protein n=1 Tax=Frankia sp. Mgl5 TaxID=2933793 RepID=UPI00200FEB08|nr:hypothetical protein [Frankia sp. Mgl5]MCK9926959.1 hypothetical protein [Frankia sp. Mgl5]